MVVVVVVLILLLVQLAEMLRSVARRILVEHIASRQVVSGGVGGVVGCRRPDWVLAGTVVMLLLMMVTHLVLVRRLVVLLLLFLLLLVLLLLLLMMLVVMVVYLECASCSHLLLVMRGRHKVVVGLNGGRRVVERRSGSKVVVVRLGGEHGRLAHRSHLVLFLVLHSSILEPNLDLALGQRQIVRYLYAPPSG
jgi:hypothetical protein